MPALVWRFVNRPNLSVPIDAARELHMWVWIYTGQFGKRRTSTWRMTEAEAAQCHDAVKVEDP
jgi:hypothetical protein